MKRILASLAACAAAVSAAAAPVDAVLVVQKHVAEEFKPALSGLGDELAAALSGPVFNVIDPNNVVGSVQNRGPWGEDMPAASATRLAEACMGDMLIVASVTGCRVRETGSPAIVKSAEMKLAVQALKLPSGAAVAGVTEKVSSGNMTPAQFEANRETVFEDLKSALAEKAARSFLAACGNADLPSFAANYVSVAFGCYWPGASVEIDGIARGTAGTFGEAPLVLKTTEGLHNLKVSIPGDDLMLPFEQQVSFEGGTTFAVVLHESAKGRAVRREETYFAALVDRLEKSGATDDEVRVLRAKGYAAYLSHSFTRIKGMPKVLAMRDCLPPDFGLGPGGAGDTVPTTTQDVLEKAGAAVHGL